jgi:hypothetical protein
MAGGTNVHRRIHEASLGRAKEKIPGRKRKNSDRTKRGRQSNADVSLDNADAVIEGALPLTFFKGGSCLLRSPQVVNSLQLTTCVLVGAVGIEIRISSILKDL